jgi:deoxyadenosine/deoxycytidine kinase
MKETKDKRQILTIQGGMAVGKTTVLKSIEKHFPSYIFRYENPFPIVTKRNSLHLDITKLKDFIVNQKLFIQAECKLYDSFPLDRHIILDRGSEDLEFYTIMFPHSLGKKWPIEEKMISELNMLRTYRSNRILFLQASADTLRKRKKLDTSRKRSSFEHYINNIFPLEKTWFSSLPHTDIVNIDEYSQEEMKSLVFNWINTNINTANKI